MSQPPSLSDCCVGPRQCLVGIAETEKDIPQPCLRYYLEVGSGLVDKGAVRDWIIKHTHLFEMRSGCSKLAVKNQISTGGVVTQNEAGGIVALTAQAQQILVQAQRQIEFAAVLVILRLPIGYMKVLRG